jgi:DNA-directed RNA polymerase specialized sigma24 family protein
MAGRISRARDDLCVDCFLKAWRAPDLRQLGAELEVM